MDYQRLKLTREDNLAIITLSDPATLNAASLEMERSCTTCWRPFRRRMRQRGR